MKQVKCIWNKLAEDYLDEGRIYEVISERSDVAYGAQNKDACFYTLKYVEPKCHSDRFVVVEPPHSTVYLVYSGQGEYEDYSEAVCNVFSSKEKADVFAKQMNESSLDELCKVYQGMTREDVCDKYHGYESTKYSVVGPFDVES